MINLFPEIKDHIEGVLHSDVLQKNADIELQQRALEYFKLAEFANGDMLATVLEEMPPFPERESSILAKLKKKKPGAAKVIEDTDEKKSTPKARPAPVMSSDPPPVPAQSSTDLLVDVFATADPAPAAPVAAEPSSQGYPSLLDGDIFGVGTSETSAPPTTTSQAPSTPEIVNDHVLKFLTKDSGVLYESDVLQIGIKMEFKKSLSRVQLFFGNKSQQSITNFSSSIQSTAELEVSEKQPVPTQVNPGEQIIQIFNIQCNKDFSEHPILSVVGSLVNLAITVPVFITKFVEPAQMDATTFFNRWRALAKPEQESQSIFTASSQIDKSAATSLLSQSGLTVLEGVDPNQENHVAASIIQTQTQTIGVLLRLEPNIPSNMYRLTVRTSIPNTNGTICEFLQSQL